MTAHIIIQANTRLEQLNILKKNIKQKLEQVKIHHATIEFVTENENCEDTNKTTTNHGQKSRSS
ncbi:MAG: hypothetical protein NTU44_17660 [Bacteroidetes bacterium]|nr:hypothetical protein [Bacteroidota bacterium]